MYGPFDMSPGLWKGANAMLRRMGVFLVGVLLVAQGRAAPFGVPIDPSQSVLYFELCVAGTCATDSSAVTGTVTIDLDAVTSPTQIWLYDFNLQLTDNLHWYLSWGILGHLTADATGVTVSYANSGVPLGPVAITAGSYTFIDVPANSTGVLSYSATGIPCYALQAAGRPCSDSMNLADQGTQTISEFTGSIASQNRVVTLSSQIDMTSPLDPNFPDLGSIHVWGTATGSVYVPYPVIAGDLNCDGAVDFGDINPFVLYLSNFAAWQTAYPGCPAENGDINGDGSFPSFGDINPFVALLSGAR
jgi:hypothetical protein